MMSCTHVNRVICKVPQGLGAGLGGSAPPPLTQVVKNYAKAITKFYFILFIYYLQLQC